MAFEFKKSPEWYKGRKQRRGESKGFRRAMEFGRDKAKAGQYKDVLW